MHGQKHALQPFYASFDDAYLVALQRANETGVTRAIMRGLDSGGGVVFWVQAQSGSVTRSEHFFLGVGPITTPLPA